MAVKFLEPGGDADFGVGTTNGFWSFVNGAAAVATDFVHGGHQKSIKYRPNAAADYVQLNNIMADAGRRISFDVYFVSFGLATDTIFRVEGGASVAVVRLRITTSGTLQLFNDANTQFGSNGSTLLANTWYRISLAYTVTSGSVNRFELFKDGVSDISVTNATLSTTGAINFLLGNVSGDTVLDFRSSDHYIDDSSSLTDTGNIWVTAKRPNANGTANNFVTQIGAGGSGYGSGHSPQVNERPLSTTNGWSVVAVGATTEEYNIESKSTGDINISTATIIDYMGWVSTSALVAETGQIIVNNATSNISITTSAKIFTKIAGSSVYPAGTGTDIGEVTDATATTVSLYECGVVVAYIPASPGSLMLLGIGA